MNAHHISDHKFLLFISGISKEKKKLKKISLVSNPTETRTLDLPSCDRDAWPLRHNPINELERKTGIIYDDLYELRFDVVETLERTKETMFFSLESQGFLKIKWWTFKL